MAEILYPEGHKASNESRVKLLSNIADVILVDDGAYYSNMNISPGIRRVNVKLKLPNKNTFARLKRFLPFIKYSPLEFLAYLLYLFKIHFKTLFIGYDYILFLSSRTDALYVGRHFFRKPIFIVHHNDIDRLFVKQLDMKLFHRFKDNVNHIVIADFIKDGLINILGVNPNKTFVIHESLVRICDFNCIPFSKKEKLIVGLGQTCSEDVIKEMIKIDQSIADKMEYKIIMRNKTVQYSGNNLEVTNSYLNRNDYNELLERAVACVLFYPLDYNLRYSGIIGDSLEHGLSVFGNEIPVVQYYSKIYPKTCHIVRTPRELFNYILSSKVDASKADITDFFEKHNPSYIERQFKEMFKC